MTAPDQPERWRERLAEWQRRRAVRREMRAVLEARRRAGLARRHAERLRRIRDSDQEAHMPRRNRNASRRPESNFSARWLAVDRHPCGCRTDGTWKCEDHWREHLAAERARRAELGGIRR